MVVGICRLSLYFADSRSLKSKRQGLRRLLDRLRSKFNAAVAEVAEQDTWQRSTIAISVVGNEGGHVETMLDRILAFVDELYVAQVLQREVELLFYNDQEPLVDDDGGA